MTQCATPKTSKTAIERPSKKIDEARDFVASQIAHGKNRMDVRLVSPENPDPKHVEFCFRVNVWAEKHVECSVMKGWKIIQSYYVKAILKGGVWSMVDLTNAKK